MPERKRPLGRSRHRREKNIGIDVKNKMVGHGLDWSDSVFFVWLRNCWLLEKDCAVWRLWSRSLCWRKEGAGETLGHRRRHVFRDFRRWSVTPRWVALVLFVWWFFCFPRTQQPNAGQQHLIREVSRSHNDTPQSVGLLWTRDLPVAGSCTWQHTTQQTDIHSPGVIRTRSYRNLESRPVREDWFFRRNVGIYSS